ncbi:unnamed protein product [Callosobruchus maculatus]|uniref:Reverse transcriptase domain-containing protein n=1 Tax=Callosobruchus maculatus TaxID=64391 RepID=A0A653BPR1_CALMS|nr:unnamed protein product [Callosobruchus maculatus]
MADRLTDIEENYKNREIRNLYRGIKAEKRGYQQKPLFYKDKEGHIISGEREIIARWQEYFEELLNNPNTIEICQAELNTQEHESNEIDKIPPTISEIREIIKKIKNNKTPGSDNITAEMFKYGGEALEVHMYNMIKNIWIKEELPEDWREAIICPIYKKGDKADCHNYRGIALLNAAYKILTMYLKDKLTVEMENIVGEYQCGFRPGRSTIDQIFTLRELQAESYEHGLQTLVLFVDFQQAYDRIKRHRMYKVLEDFKINAKLRRMVQLTLRKTENMVRINNEISEKFEVNEGVRQGDPLSTVLFSLCLEKVIRGANINREGLLYHRKHQCLAFADDVAIVTRGKKELQEVVRRLDREAKKLGLYINEGKTTFMEWSDDGCQVGERIKIELEEGGTVTFEKVERFVYLGTVITNQPNTTEEILSRQMAGNRCAYALNSVLRSKEISRRAKIRIYRTVIFPVVTYASEVWTLNKKEQNMLEVWERKILRKIFGGKLWNNIWIRRSNMELKSLYEHPSITGVVKAQRLRWLGHVARMSDRRIPKKIQTCAIGMKKRRGRPKSRWRQQVEEDLKTIGIEKWNQEVTNKKKWRKITYQAMGLLGL